MKMLVAVSGKICLPIKFSPDRTAATFTLQAGQDRYLVETVGLDQYKTMEGVSLTQASKLVIIGHAYTFRSQRCGQHHVGVKPVFIVPMDHHDNLELLQTAAGQWFSSNLAKMREG